MDRVTDILGETVVKVIHEHAVGGNIPTQKMKDLAQQLGRRVKGKIMCVNINILSV